MPLEPILLNSQTPDVIMTWGNTFLAAELLIYGIVCHLKLLMRHHLIQLKTASTDSALTKASYTTGMLSAELTKTGSRIIGPRPSDHYFRSVCSMFVCLFVCAEFFSDVFDFISIKLGYMLYVWV